MYGREREEEEQKMEKMRYINRKYWRKEDKIKKTLRGREIEGREIKFLRLTQSASASSWASPGLLKITRSFRRQKLYRN